MSNIIKQNDNKLINIFKDKPSYSFNEENEREIDSQSIIINSEDKINEYSKKDKDNYWYKKFKLFGKTYIQMSKNSVAEEKDYVIYYCNLHWTTMDSHELTKKGNIKKKCKMLF